ncbi:hypothetical protein KC19_12G187000 [Ceratodon purpureus]|uniref:Uncharacterized protein n=1 Tax=Ceratodon purpureus TaxID=3225 RepID=A0A8T0GB21_CERPU|nr:hypothetical protein KC19_12G187000 [Ceratodon purpureus]
MCSGRTTNLFVLQLEVGLQLAGLASGHVPNIENDVRGSLCVCAENILQLS